MENNWISVKDKLPNENETVWICNNETRYVNLGSFVYIGNEGWFWSESNGTIYSHEGNIVAECETEDLDVTHWMPLPKLPK